MDIRHTEQKRRVYMARLTNNQAQLQQQYQEQKQLLKQQREAQHQYAKGGGRVIGNPLDGIDEETFANQNQIVSQSQRVASSPKEPLLGQGGGSGGQQTQMQQNNGR